jgi:hypothetical protein
VTTPAQVIANQVGPYVPYTRPIWPPFTLPEITDEPRKILRLNDQWMSYVIGCAQTLVRYETWETDRDTTLEMVQRAHGIQAQIEDDCPEAPDTVTNWVVNAIVHAGYTPGIYTRMIPVGRAYLVNVYMEINVLGIPDIEFVGTEMFGLFGVGGNMEIRVSATSGTAHDFVITETDCFGTVNVTSGLSADMYIGPVERKKIRVTYDGACFIQFYCYGPYTCGPV